MAHDGIYLTWEKLQSDGAMEGALGSVNDWCGLVMRPTPDFTFSVLRKIGKLKYFQPRIRQTLLRNILNGFESAVNDSPVVTLVIGRMLGATRVGLREKLELDGLLRRFEK